MEETSTEMDLKIELDSEVAQDEKSNLEEKQKSVVDNEPLENPEEIHILEIKQEETKEEMMEEIKEIKDKIEESKENIEEIKENVEENKESEEIKLSEIKGENDINEDIILTLDENSMETMEPGELPTNNEVQITQDSDMNVLEAILGDGDGAKDDFDNEIANTTSMKRTRSRTKAATSLTPKMKKTPKRKAKKTPKKAESQNPATENKLLVKDDNTKTTDLALVESSQASVSEEGNTKPKDLPAKITEDSKETQNKKATVNNGKTIIKNTKKKKVTKTGTKKDIKKPEPKGKKVEEDKMDSKQEEKEKELEIKVKELEKLVKAPPLDTDKTLLETASENIAGKSPVSTRKRKNSDSSLKDKPRKTKIKQEESTTEIAPAEEALIEDLPDDDLLNETENDKLDDNMKVLDGYSDHGSNFSHSRSRSLSGSFSVELSNLSGSSLDDIDGEDKNNTKRKKKRTSAEKVQEHKDFIDEMLKGARYFIIKSNNYENVSLSKAKGVWATPPANERKLNDAFKHSTNVILVFSVKESGRFQGFARLASESRHDGIPVPWVLPPGFDRRILGGTFKVDWLNRKEVTFSKCANLRNPWNENKEVKICRDGQELEPSVGEVLCRMFEDDLTIDFERILRHAKRYKSHDHKGDRFKRGNFHGNDWRGRGGFRGGGRGAGARGAGRFQSRGGGSGGDLRRRRGSFGGGTSSAVRYHNDNRRQDNRRRDNSSHHRGISDHRRPVDNSFLRPRSRSPEHRHRYERENRDRRHKDRVREFLKEDRSKYGVREETLLHGSYSDYVREFRQKQLGSHRSSSSSNNYYSSSNYGGSSSRHSYEANAASAEEFLRRSMRSSSHR